MPTLVSVNTVSVVVDSVLLVDTGYELAEDTERG